MATRKLLVHASEQISANKLITFNIPSFATIDQLFLTFTKNGAPVLNADILSSISQLRLILDGADSINISPNDLVSIYKSLGVQVVQNITNSNVLPLLIAPLLYKEPRIEDTFAIGCDGWRKDASGKFQKLTNIQLQIQCAGTITDITDVQVSSERRELGTNGNITRAYCKLLTYTQGLSAAGTSTVDTLPRDMNEGYIFVMAKANGGKISKGECIANNIPVIQEVDLATNNMLLNCRGFGATMDGFNYSFTDGGTQDVLSMKGITDLRFKTTYSEAPTGNEYNMIAASIGAV